MARDSTRIGRLADLIGRSGDMGASEREELFRKTREEDPGLAACLAGLLEHGGPIPASPAALIQWIRERASDSAVTLACSESRATTAEVIQRLAKRGDSFDRYELQEEIGEGGQGIVMQAWDKDLRRRLAMKIMLRKPVTSESANGESRKLSRFLEEAQVTGQLVHPGIVPVHELGLDHQGRVYFTMQLVKGRDFRHVIDLVHREKEGWTLVRALGVILKVCETMAYAHSKGVVHRDLKPGNLMVGKFGEVYVMDWGLARVQGCHDPRDLRSKSDTDTRSGLVETERHRHREQRPDSALVTSDGTVLGTPAYMAVEQALGLVEQVDRRSDVYSVGAILYHLLAGHSPYVPSGAKISQRTVLALVIEGPPAPLAQANPRAPRELVAICEKAMSRQPENRYGDMMDMAKDLEAYLGRRPVSPLAPRLGYALKLAIERNRLEVWTATAAALLVIVLVAVFITHLSGAVQETNAALEDNRRLLDVLSAPALVREFDGLFPLLPEVVPRLRSWLKRADDLLSRRADKYELARRRGEDLGALLADLDGLAKLRPRAAENLRTAESLHHDTIEAPAGAWSAAIADIAGLEAYGGLALAPQLGLVPLGRNASSGLWEFWDVLSGARPEMDVDLGEPVVHEDSGIVLVLIPGGSFTMGSPLTEVGRDRNERPHRVALLPYFLSKYEITQAQWLRVMGENPSGSMAGYPPVGIYAAGPQQEITLLNPVENVSWIECQEFARRLALELPTEAQWERGCRAGTSTAFCWGDQYAALEGNENIRDQAFARSIGLPTSARWADDFWHHAPVGSFAPNGFGLYDMHGNVSEWCRDDDLQDYPDDSAVPGDGLQGGGDARRRVFRGGSWYLSPEFCRCAFRHFDFPRSANFSRGLRVARGVEASSGL